MTTGIGKEFMEKTKPQYLAESQQRQGHPQPPLESDYDPTAILIPLPEAENLPAFDLELRQAVEQRTSLRKYKKTALTLEELSYLLWTTQGVKAVTNRPVTLRTVPSAGARHAFETYLLINQVSGIDAGLYRYIALEHALLPVNLSESINEEITKACFGQQQVFTSAVTFIWAAELARMYWRYGERGYRYLHLDAGHVCQNLYLAAEAVNSGVCAIAAYNDDELNQTIGLDGENQFVIYLGTVGKR